MPRSTPTKAPTELLLTVGGTSATSAADQFTYIAAPTAGNVGATAAYNNTNNPIALSIVGGAPTSVAVAAS
ncbi:hypothetical protein ACHMW7_18505 [Aminobacter sp. UC22_36]|uniref:hypothetical protein n=1 Tax=Aminobacter sp. UC22_36 TaxID=3374549 RepID=UPI003757C7C2